jgi:hypothetical protein
VRGGSPTSHVVELPGKFIGKKERAILAHYAAVAADSGFFSKAGRSHLLRIAAAS